jgi:hypothetical protein
MAFVTRFVGVVGGVVSVAVAVAMFDETETLPAASIAFIVWS